MSSIDSHSTIDIFSDSNSRFFAQRMPLGLRADSEYSRTPNFIGRISDLASEDLSFVEKRLMTDVDCDIVASRYARREFLRFFSLHFLTGESLAPNPPADAFWHSFLLFTAEYRSFCEKHFSRFIDHTPVDGVVRTGDESNNECALYKSCYGDEPYSTRPSIIQRVSRIRSRLKDFDLPRSKKVEKRVGTDVSRLNEMDGFTRWGDWNNSWQNWGDWKDWDKWDNKSCYSGPM